MIKIPLLRENSPKFSPYVMKTLGPGENFPRLSLNMMKISICREENSSFFLNTKRFFWIRGEIPISLPSTIMRLLLPLSKATPEYVVI
jgi:hypothetical protein